MAARIGSELGARYQVEEFLGQGAFATVWKVLDLSTGEHLAAKRFATAVTRSSMFFRELSALFRLSHPHIVRAVNLLELSERVRYLFLEYCAGGSLRDHLRRARQRGADPRQPCPLERVRELTLQMTLGLAEAHGVGLIHRDLKPENVLLDPNSDTPFAGTVKLADFGLVKVWRSGEGGPPSDGVLRALSGSPAYMAPEQFLNQYSAASDYYALGVIVFELLHGQPPFLGSPEELARCHLNEPPPRRHDLPDPWPDILDRLLLKHPHERGYDHTWLLERLRHAPGSHRLVPELRVTSPPSVTVVDSISSPTIPQPAIANTTPITTPPRASTNATRSLIRATPPRMARCLGVAALDLVARRLDDQNVEFLAITSCGLFRIRPDQDGPPRLTPEIGVEGATVDDDGVVWLFRGGDLLAWPPRSTHPRLVARLDGQLRALLAPRPPQTHSFPAASSSLVPPLGVILDDGLFDLEPGPDPAIPPRLHAWSQGPTHTDHASAWMRFDDGRLAVARDDAPDGIDVFTPNQLIPQRIPFASGLCQRLWRDPPRNAASPPRRDSGVALIRSREDANALVRFQAAPDRDSWRLTVTVLETPAFELAAFDAIAPDPAIVTLDLDGVARRWRVDSDPSDAPTIKLDLEGRLPLALAAAAGKFAVLAREDGVDWVHVSNPNP